MSACMAVMLAALGARALIMWIPLPVFDVDPAFDPSPFAGAGPALGCALDGIAVLCAVALMARARRDGSLGALRIAVPVTLLSLPLVVVGAWWGLSDAEQLWRASAWVSGAVSAAALVACACASRAAGRVAAAAAIATVAGVLALLAVRGGVQVLVEHPATVAHYDANREGVLASQGWSADSPQAKAYERRLRQREATGWFGFSNVYASCAAAGSVLLCGLAMASRGRARIVQGALGMALCALVALSGSKGGIAAVAVGLAVASLAAATAQRRSGPAWVRTALLCAPLAALALPVARLLAGGLDWAERSLLVRAGYLQSAWSAVAAEPLRGWGPAGFQRADLSFRPSWSIEEVSSAHAAIADWCAALGVPAGLALVAALAVLAWQAPKALRATDQPALGTAGNRPEREVREAVRIACAATGLAWLLGFGCELQALDAPALLARVAGLALALLVARCAAGTVAAGIGSAGVPWLACGTCGAAAALLAHGQIDMAFALPGSAPVAWLMLGACACAGCAAAAPAEPPSETPARVGAGAWLRIGAPLARTCLVPAGLALLIAAGALARQDLVLVRAAEDVHAAGGSCASRAAATEHLLHAWTIEPPRSPVAVAAARQASASIRSLSADAPRDDVERVRAVTLDAMEAVAAASELHASAFAAAQARAALATAAAQRGWSGWTAAIAAWEDAAALDPRSVSAWLGLADARQGAGDRRGAADAIDRALAADGTFALDPLRQMDPRRRRQWESQASRLRGP